METKVQWYNKSWVLWALLIFVPYLGIPYMWVTKKDFTTKKKTILSIVFALWLFIAIGIGNSNSDTPYANESDPSSSVSESNTDAEDNENDSSNSVSTIEKIPDIPLADDVERDIWKVVDLNEAKLVSIETINAEGSTETSIVASVLCKNDEVVVDTILAEVKTVIVESARNDEIIFTFGDIKEGDNASLLLTAVVYKDGTIEKSMISIDFNSARNIWIRDQFSAWDGSHKQLEDLILKNLNDEKSYEHIETTYIDVNSKDRVDSVNKILSDNGYSQRVEMDDLFIITEFSAKNAFGGTIKSTAFGIVSYDNQTITLIGIE